jgi:DNA-binding response OmpR family regulator
MNVVGRILVIDDEATLRRTLTRILEKAGCQVETAEDGRQALIFLGGSEFDLVFLDIHLPHIDGIEVLREVRQQNQSLPVVLLTGYGTMQSAVEALRLGATDYLLKPIDPDVLVSRTRTILRERAVEQRKKEIREQIVSLQAELDALDRENPETSFVTMGASQPAERFLKRGRLILDLFSRTATLGDEVLILPPAAFDYLVVFTRHSPEVVDYQTLVSEAQDYQVSANEARELAKWHVHVLRQAIEDRTKDNIQILNVRGRGYRLVID